MPTKYSNEHGGGNKSKPNPYADIPVAISGTEYEGPETPELICPKCRVITYQTHGVDYEYHCRCGHIINPINEDVQTKSKLSMPRGSDKETNISYTPDPNDSFMNKDKDPDIPSGLHTLQQGSSTIKITFDETRDGAGRIIKRNRWS